MKEEPRGEIVSYRTNDGKMVLEGGNQYVILHGKGIR